MRDCYHSPSKSNPTLISGSYISRMALCHYHISASAFSLTKIEDVGWLWVPKKGCEEQGHVYMHFQSFCRAACHYYLQRLMQESLGYPWLYFHHGCASSPLAAIIELALGACFPWYLDWAVRLRKNIFNTRENKSISLTAFPSFQRTY